MNQFYQQARENWKAVLSGLVIGIVIFSTALFLYDREIKRQQKVDEMQTQLELKLKKLERQQADKQDEIEAQRIK
jgi:uncharacterized membrane-anchored protein YhcB (DUF1043 family)